MVETQKNQDVKSLPPGTWSALVHLTRLARLPLERFLQIEAASGILLLVSAAVALIWANSPWASAYTQFWNTPFGIQIGELNFSRSLGWYVNDGLMVIFFFVVGLEIRREIHRGELSQWRRASLPLAAALGGMLVPAGIYLLLAGAPETRQGWGVPMATDIAFALGILTLLGKRVPPALRVLLLAVAVIDDLGAILVIAFFYSSGISVSGLMIAGAGFLGVFIMQRLGIRSKLAYIFPSVVAWAGIYIAGAHPTIAGVIVGLVTPVTAWFGPEGFLQSVRQKTDELDRLAHQRDASTHEFAVVLKEFEKARREVLSPSDSLIESLHPWVAFVIMPIFALANSGVSLVGADFDQNSWTISSAIAAGLILGKPLGILFMSWISLRLGFADLPAGITLKHLVVLGIVAGIGFTMALFIAQLAFTDSRMLDAAKVGVLGASLCAGILALILGQLLLKPTQNPMAALTADEAEASTIK